MSNTAPYSWGEARDAINAAKAVQRAAEDAVKEAFKGYGAAERAYRLALSQKIVTLRAEGQPVTIVQDLAKGDPHVADLRFKRDIAEGVKEAALSAQWRHSADRRALEELVDWSKRRDLAEGYHGAQEPQWSGTAA